jgi:hypothetical protein
MRWRRYGCGLLGKATRWQAAHRRPWQGSNLPDLSLLMTRWLWQYLLWGCLEINAV